MRLEVRADGFVLRPESNSDIRVLAHIRDNSGTDAHRMRVVGTQEGEEIIPILGTKTIKALHLSIGEK